MFLAPDVDTRRGLECVLFEPIWSPHSLIFLLLCKPWLKKSPAAVGQACRCAAGLEESSRQKASSTGEASTFGPNFTLIHVFGGTARLAGAHSIPRARHSAGHIVGARELLRGYIEDTQYILGKKIYSGCS